MLIEYFDKENEAFSQHQQLSLFPKSAPQALSWALTHDLVFHGNQTLMIGDIGFRFNKHLLLPAKGDHYGGSHYKLF